MLTIALYFVDSWVKKVSVGFLQQLDLKHKNKTSRYNADSSLMG